MRGEDRFVMTQREIIRLQVVQKIKSREMTQRAGSEVLGISERQVRRLVRRVRSAGDLGVVHRGRGRRSPRKIDERVQREAVRIYRSKYWDFGPTLAVEKLEEVEGIRISKETMRQWLLREGLWARKRRSRAYRQRRERKACYGQMVQVDGSHHDWLEGRGPALVLMGHIDDATSRFYGKFYEYEGTVPAMESLGEYIRRHGAPQSVYVDKHSTYRSQDRDRWRAITFGEESLSHYERGCKELGITVIHAHSPQAKGRVERSFRTLQDRLVKELRLARAKTLEEANKELESYLPKHNERFAVAPQSRANVHRKVGMKQVREALSVKTKRVVRNDYTIAHKKVLYQLQERTFSREVEIREPLSGRMEIWDRRKSLRYRRIVPKVRTGTKSIRNRTLSFC